MEVYIENDKNFYFEIPFLREFIPGLPELDLRHIHRLTNEVGIIQHAKFSVPNLHHGYCLDDNARALQLLVMIHAKYPSEQTEQLLYKYLSYIHYMQLGDGYFRNFLSFDNQFLDEKGTEDSFGRTILALGVFCKLIKNIELEKYAQEIFHAAIKHTQNLRSIRAAAYCVLGITHYLERHPDTVVYIELLDKLSAFIIKEYDMCASVHWPWYEKSMTYDNALIPLSLLRTNKILPNKNLIRIARASSNHLDKIVFRKGYLSTIGNRGWYSENKTIDSFDQQPIEIPNLILLYKEWNSLNNNDADKERMLQSFKWFFGGNDLKATLYNEKTGGCFDGLGEHEINLNQGAESALAFWTSYMYITTDFT